MNALRLFLPLFAGLALLPAQEAFAQDPDPADGPVFVARDVEPTIINVKELQQVLQRVYPSGYRDTGLDVMALMWIYVGADGSVGAARVLKTTGYDVFDQAAKQVAMAMEFDPALRGGEPLAVWINQAIKFDSGDSGRFLEGPAMTADDVVRERNAAKRNEDDNN